MNQQDGKGGKKDAKKDTKAAPAKKDAKKGDKDAGGLFIG